MMGSMERTCPHPTASETRALPVEIERFSSVISRLAHHGECLGAVEVEGFRWVGAASEIKVAPGPGLTLVPGWNGSGESTFAEGREVLLTADPSRWAGANRIRKDGFRNAHEPDPSRVLAKFSLAGQQSPLSVDRNWDAVNKVDQSHLQLSGYGIREDVNLATLGWAAS